MAHKQQICGLWKPPRAGVSQEVKGGVGITQSRVITLGHTSGRVSNQWTYLSSPPGGLGGRAVGVHYHAHPHPHNTASMKPHPGLVSCKSPHYQKKQNRKWDNFCGDGQAGCVLILGLGI